MSETNDLDGFLAFATRFASLSTSQLLQDLWVIWELGFGPGRVFVDVGAADGVSLSNSYLLERIGWTGLLVEPNRNFHPRLKQSRKSPLVPNCLWSESGLSMSLRSVDSFLELSRLEAIEVQDNHEEEGRRAHFQKQEVESISLVDLLAGHGLPTTVDYLSIDIEGSELEVLKGFDFDRFQFLCLTVEHNHTEARERIHDVLKGRGYRRKWTEISGWDDWYVLDGRPRARPDAARPAQEAYRRLYRLRKERGEADAAAALASEIALLWSTRPAASGHEPLSEDPALGSQLAASLLAQGSLAEAERISAEALERAPTSGAAHNIRSHVLAKLDRLEEAAAASARAVELDPGQNAWRIRLGNLLFRLGRAVEAAEALGVALEHDPDDVSALTNLARVCEALGRDKEAEALAQRAVGVEPNDRASGELLARLRRRSEAARSVDPGEPASTGGSAPGSSGA